MSFKVSLNQLGKLLWFSVPLRGAPKNPGCPQWWYTALFWGAGVPVCFMGWSEDMETRSSGLAPNTDPNSGEVSACFSLIKPAV